MEALERVVQIPVAIRALVEEHAVVSVYERPFLDSPVRARQTNLDPAHDAYITWKEGCFYVERAAIVNDLHARRRQCSRSRVNPQQAS